ncbi:stage II sporulation protein D [Lentibacillus halodurans]|uniref:Stage II sporulation protein D n=1 Tax=Lentibacillus halodurans TaxID=237679 RepID=A0A1I0ZML9_9BACI|nr:stage II sporulation protein D [Lentibacillus halodurans]SFB26741.1 stage II sporulation protein D [Lentibacillus halodurans]
MKKSKIIPRVRKKNKQRKSQSLQLLQKNRKPVRLNKPLASWKGSTVLFLSCLITVILVVPTLIVVPFMSDANEQEEAVEQNPGDVEIAMGDSPFAVEVMRANSEQVETVPLETYVSRVVASETPAEFELEALKAQALAARTFIVNRLLHQDNGEQPDVTDTTSDQVYHNDKELRNSMGSDYDEEMNKIKKAVAETKGEILTYENTPITAAYFSTSNGYTENSEDYWDDEVPYLRSVESPWDTNTPKYLDQKVFTIAEVEDLLETDIPNVEDLSMEISRTEGNRVDQVTIGETSYSGRDIREDLGLRSSDFSVEKKNDHLIFTTKGFGHGIGMSQFGANGMAEEGKTYEEIVKHYYQGVEISTVSDTAPTLVAK